MPQAATRAVPRHRGAPRSSEAKGVKPNAGGLLGQSPVPKVRRSASCLLGVIQLYSYMMFYGDGEELSLGQLFSH